MALTRANVESILIRRVGRLMTAADMDGSTVAGTNADLNDPIGYALRASGLSVSSVAAVADADVAGVGDDLIDQVLDIAEWRTLLSIEGNYDDVDISANGRSESLSQTMKQVQAKIDRLQKRITEIHGVGLGTLTGGSIALDFMAKGDDAFVVEASEE